MDQKYYSIIEMGFTGAVVLGFALWQLRSVSREIKRDKELPKGASPKGASPKGSGHPVGEHRLDDR